MRGTRWLILLAIVAILGGAGYFYRLDTRLARERTPKQPPMLSPDTNSTAVDYEYGQSTAGKTNYSVKAKSYRQIRDTPNYELEGLELHLTEKDQQHYDLIKSAKAEFNQSEGRMFSDGEVEITLDVPLEGKPAHQLTTIKSSGVTFDSKTGKASTSREADFTFENGDGKSTGAAYDPQTHELHLTGGAVMNMRGQGKHSQVMHVEAGEIIYREAGSIVTLTPWSRMTRAETTIDAGLSVLVLKDKLVQAIDSQNVHGVDKYPDRELHYSADGVHVAYDDDGNVKNISGVGHAHVHQEGAGGMTDTTSEWASLDFVPGDTQSILSHVVATKGVVIRSRPAPDKAGKRAEDRVLKSENVEINMRSGGKEIANMRTHGPGTVEFFPNAPDQHHRLMTGEEMNINYAAKNVVKDFSTTNASTLTYAAAGTKPKAGASGAKVEAPGKTSSRTLAATFDAKGQLATMKQTGNFVYEDGDRHAKAATASLDQQANTMDLETEARIWDSNGTTDADKIHLIQKTGDYVADGHVMTSHVPDQSTGDKKKPSGEMLDGDENIQGSAPHMSSANHNKLVHYEGGSVLWQGGDRIEAREIDIDREKHILSATGKVATQFQDDDKNKDKNKDKDDGKDNGKEKDKKSTSTGGTAIVKVSVSVPLNPPAPPSALPPVYTIVSSDKLIYTDADRMAHYTGNVILNRPGLNVKSMDLRAYLNPKDSGEDSRLNHAIGDGKVEIVESRPDRQRIGKGEHGEYITKEDKVILRGNLADLYDSIKKDDSHGTELTYYTSDDRLLIVGAPTKLVTSHLQRKKHPNANSGNR
jgi:lipopolysaccharide export system protein LptA